LQLAPIVKAGDDVLIHFEKRGYQQVDKHVTASSGALAIPFKMHLQVSVDAAGPHAKSKTTPSTSSSSPPIAGTELNVRTAEPSDVALRTRISGLIGDAVKLQEQCQAVPDPYKTPWQAQPVLAQAMLAGRAGWGTFYRWTWTRTPYRVGRQRFFTHLRRTRRTPASPHTALNWG
jgi:hypothetical protein